MEKQKFRKNDQGKIELFNNETQEIEYFSFPIDASEALCLKNDKGENRFSMIEIKEVKVIRERVEDKKASEIKNKVDDIKDEAKDQEVDKQPDDQEEKLSRRSRRSRSEEE